MVLMITLAIQISNEPALGHIELNMKALEEEFGQGLMRLYGISAHHIAVEVRNVMATAGEGPFGPRNKRKDQNPYQKG